MERALSGHAGNHRRWRRALARGLTQVWCGLLLFASLLVSAGSLPAAPPGAQRLDRARITVIHYAGDSILAAAVLDAATARDTFPWLPRSKARIVIMVAPDAATFREWAGPSAGPATAAVAFAEQHRVVMRGRGATPNSGDPLRTLRHELAHVALYEFLGFHAVRWFDEGYASLAAGEDRNDGFLAVNAALVFRRMPSLAALDTLLTSPRPEVARAGYSLALRAVTDLALIDRVRGLDPLLVEWKARGTLDLALRGAFAVTTEGFERDWQQRTRWRFALLSVVLDSAMGGLALVLLFAPLYRSRRNAQRARLDEMRRREAITELTNRSEVVDTLMRSIRPATDASGPHA